MNRTYIVEALRGKDIDKEVLVKGWVRTRRDSKGGFSFIELNDGSCFNNLQIVVDADLDNYQDEILKLFPGSSIAVKGILINSQGGGQGFEIKAEEVKVYGYCDPDKYVIGKQRVSFERLREVAHLRVRTNTFGAVTRVRNKLAKATHDFFQDRGFFYINTPIITASDCEGAGEMFRVSTIDPASAPKNDGKVDYSQDFFGKESFLTVSGQLEGECYACGLGNIYTFGPTFRAENSNTSRHLSEFWMIEPEMAFSDLDDDARLAEEFIKYLITTVLNECNEDMEFFSKRIDKTILDTLIHVKDSEFVRIKYTDAIDILNRSGQKFEYETKWGCDLQTEHERFLTEKEFKKPIIVTDYPSDIKAFYMKQNDDGKTVAAMDVLVPKIGEIIGGSQREDDLEKLDARIKDQGMGLEPYWWYRDLRKFGTVPHAGFGLGFERFVQFVTGMDNIRDVIPFPRTPKSAEF
ncbi:MAG: asparagine--tRNA ligase [Candidatus Brocadiaceae bacterium]|nr:asparagine--tRNA ligase [Candidatus Brocadiaceae bacterium]